MKIFVFGNPLVKEDAVSYAVGNELRNLGFEVEFVNDPLSIVDQKHERIVIVDTVLGIDKVRCVTLDEITVRGKMFSLHGFDLSNALKLLEVLGLLDDVVVIGVPSNAEPQEVVADVIAEIEKV